jgi:hypothetical protein
MTQAERELVVRQIEALLTEDTDSTTLSNRLFQQGTGLFGRLGPTEEDRRGVVASDLWKRAKTRLRELEARDLERFREVAKKVEEHWKPGTFVLKLESAPTK